MMHLIIVGAACALFYVLGKITLRFVESQKENDDDLFI
jgi:hypothetical protein